MKIVQISDPSCWDRELPHVLAGVVAERVKEGVAQFCLDSGISAETLKTLMTKWNKKILDCGSITPVYGTTEKLGNTSSAVPAYSHALLSEVVTPLGDVQMCSGNPRAVKFPAGGPIYPVDACKYDLRGNPKSNIKVKYRSSSSDAVLPSAADTDHNRICGSYSSSNSSGSTSAHGGGTSEVASSGAAKAAPKEPREPCTSADADDPDLDWDADDAYYRQFARRGYDTFIIAHMGAVRACR
jgi:hypothetical protein